MNPQYQPPQAYSQNRPSPSLTPSGGFQNVSLGPSKPPGNVPLNGPHVQNSTFLQHEGPQQDHDLSSNHFVPRPQHNLTQPGQPPQAQLQQTPRFPGSNLPPPGIPPSQLPPSATSLGGPGGPPSSFSSGQLPPHSAPNIGMNPPQARPPSKDLPPHGPPPGSNLPQANLSGHFPPGQFPPPPSNSALSPPPSGQFPPQNMPQKGQSQPGNVQNPASLINGGGPQFPPSGPGNVPLPAQSPEQNANGPSHFPPSGAPNTGSMPPPKQNILPPGPNQINQPSFMNQQQPPHPGQQQPPLANQPPLPGQPPRQLPPNQFGQPPLPGQFLQQPPLPNQQNQFGQPPMPNQFGQPPLPGQPNQFGQPPLPGQPNQFGQPPLPNQQNQFNQPPLPGQMPNQFGQPPLPGQQHNPNQLANQMQGMNLNGPRQYPGGPMKSADNGPHMPPPLSQQQQQGIVNGQQMRSPQAPGYPPMPGQGGVPGGPGNYSQSAYQQQQRRLDPDQMPSPIQVMEDDQLTRSGVFVTNQKGQVPPLVSTKFVVQDGGNSSPRYVRSTMYNVPISQDLMKQTSVPFGLVISPMARTIEGEYPPPVVNFGEIGPVRCIRCKAYMCPFMQFIDSGRRFQCLFCKATTEVPAEYFQHLDHTGQRMDRFERPELVLGTYEFLATPEYCRNNTLPKPPAFIFVIDVSYNNVKSGLVHLLCAQMKEIIHHLPVDQGQEKSNMRVGFITYNSSVHFYNIKGTLAAPQMLVVGDTQEMFMPLLDGFLCTPEESESVIDALMQQIPSMFADTRETETVLLPAILAGLEALKASECAGKLLVFHSTLPVAEAPGKLKNRDDRKLLGTDKERTILTPQTQAYSQLGQECVQVGCSVDLFIFNNAYIDIATIGQVSRLSGGEIFKYTYFQADTDGDRLISDIITDISRPIAFDGVMRVRTSTGIRPTDFYGHCFMSNTTDVELASIDCDKAIVVEIKHDDKLSEEEGVYLQIALLYTSCSGQRRLRIMNLSLKTCSQMTELFRSCELDTLMNFFTKQSVFRLLEHSPKAVKDGLANRTAQILANYRKNCANPSSAGQLILPECMKLLPLYVNCLMRSDAMSGGSDMTVDDRSFVMQAVMSMDVPTSVGYLYPRLIPIHGINVEEDPITIPSPIRCTLEKMNDMGVYILENGIHMFLWISLAADGEFIQQLFGVPSAAQVNIESSRLPVVDDPVNEAVHNIIHEIRKQRHRCMRLTLVRQREKLEPVFKHFLVEDRGVDGSPSYVDFLCHMHKEIRNLLS